MQPPVSLSVIPIPEIPEVRSGDRLHEILADALGACALQLTDDDILVVTSKIVSKAEGRTVAISEADPSARRRLILDEAACVLRHRGTLYITQTQHGFVCANAGVDLSNSPPGVAILLPVDPDRSARRLRDQLMRKFDLGRFGVVITDTFGRPWRQGLTDVAIGSAGFAPLWDLRDTRDSAGRQLNVTQVALVDEIAAAAELVMGKAWGRPAALVRGLQLSGDGSVTDLQRPPRDDLFR